MMNPSHRQRSGFNFNHPPIHRNETPRPLPSQSTFPPTSSLYSPTTEVRDFAYSPIPISTSTPEATTTASSSSNRTSPFHQIPSATLPQISFSGPIWTLLLSNYDYECNAARFPTPALRPPYSPLPSIHPRSSPRRSYPPRDTPLRKHNTSPQPPPFNPSPTLTRTRTPSPSSILSHSQSPSFKHLLKENDLLRQIITSKDEQIRLGRVSEELSEDLVGVLGRFVRVLEKRERERERERGF